MRSLFRKLEWKHRNNKFLYYSKGALRELIPTSFFRNRLQKELNRIKNFDFEYIREG